MEYRATGICFVWKSKVKRAEWGVESLGSNKARVSMSFERRFNREFLTSLFKRGGRALEVTRNHLSNKVQTET